MSQMGSASAAVPRLKVPAYNWWNEGLHGVARSGYATMFPQAIGMAAMWDAPLMKQIGEVIATEARAKNNEALRHGNREIYFGLTFWSPNINIFRDPRWGRGQETWYPGEAGARDIADVLTGAVNPSGRLPLTFYTSENDLPSFDDYSMERRTYRYFTGKPLYGFGFGLSYTKFAYGRLKLSTAKVMAGDTLTAEVDVKNTGSRTGEEVAQLYLLPLADGNGGLSPRLQMESFQRVLLKLGETRRVRFTLDPRQLSEVDAQGVRAVQAGSYRIAVGGAQPSANDSETAAFTITGTQELPR